MGKDSDRGNVDDMTIPGWHTFWNVFTLKAKLVSVGVVLLIIVIGVVTYKCSHRPAKIDLETVNKINNANEKERKAELQKVIEDNADVVRTVDNRSAVTEVNVVERNRAIDDKIKAVDAKIAEAKSQGRDVTQDELNCLLIPGDCK